ncbi:MAG: hypothetical protein LBE55_06660, partial [Clostridiales bacterium]|nr:hypothetical protein [Clostridiales bacterium]
MGTFFSTFQVKSNQPRPKFEKGFTDYMKSIGLVPVKAEDAGFSVILAFSENWVTVCPSYDAGYENEAQGLAKAMKTTCINTSVFDSDCLYLYFYDAVTGREDKVMAGWCEEYCDPEDGINGEGNPHCWKPLLVEGATWEQLTEVWSGDYVFIEEAL